MELEQELPLFFDSGSNQKGGGFGWLRLHNTACHSAKISGVQFIEKWDSGRDMWDENVLSKLVVYNRPFTIECEQFFFTFFQSSFILYLMS